MMPSGWPAVGDEAGLGGLAAAADVEGVDDVVEAEPARGVGHLRGVQLTAVVGAAGVEEPARTDALCRSSARRCSQMLAA